MEKEKFERAIVINKRINELDEVLKEISPNISHFLSYIDNENTRCDGYKMRIIENILDKHDKMIRAEIQQEIDNLYKEIESL